MTFIAHVTLTRQIVAIVLSDFFSFSFFVGVGVADCIDGVSRLYGLSDCRLNCLWNNKFYASSIIPFYKETNNVKNGEYKDKVTNMMGG